MKGILEGIRVVECTNWIVGPLAGMLLAELGAEVIKVEDPVEGDRSRGAVVFLGQSIELSGGKTMAFESYNCGKKSICVNLKLEKGREVLSRLVAKSDVFMHNFTPDSASQMRLEYKDLSSLNPKLIYASASGYGQKGPSARLPAMDECIHARAGLLKRSVDMDPCLPYPVLADEI